MSANSGSSARKRSRAPATAGSGELMPRHPPLDLARERARENPRGRPRPDVRIVEGRRGLASRVGDEPAAAVGERPEHLALARTEQRGGERRLRVVEVRVEQDELPARARRELLERLAVVAGAQRDLPCDVLVPDRDDLALDPEP